MQGVPVITGPSTYNFTEAVNLLKEAGALKKATAQQVHDALLSWLSDEGQRFQAGRAGQAVVKANQGATARQVDRLEVLLR